MKLKRVRVSDIVEYPTLFSTNCSLFHSLGKNVSQCTEEEIAYILSKTAGDPKYLEICTASKQCKSIMDGLKDYVQFANDPIRLEEYNGKYRASEGKHRVCMAKRINLNWLWAETVRLETDDLELLGNIGNPGIFSLPIRNRYAFVLIYDVGNLKVKVIRDIEKVNIWETTEVKGIEYMIEKKKWFQKARVVVKISSDHPKTKVWLKAMPFPNGYPLIQESINLYRYGFWRKHHERGVTAQFILS